MKWKWLTWTILAVLLTQCGEAPPSAKGDIGSRMGSGNFWEGRLDKATMLQFQVMKNIGAGTERTVVYSNKIWKDGKVAFQLDGFMLEAYKQGVTPMLLVAHRSLKQDGPVGDFRKWYEIGQAYAERYRPNSDWLKSKGIRDWGISDYSAINEPEQTDIPLQDYHDALQGFGKGIHSVDPGLKAAPGGFVSVKMLPDGFKGYGKAIADLWNDGTLDAMDIHRYFDIQYQPMEGTYERSAQRGFETAKKIIGITRDIDYWCTEFNYKKRGVTEEQAAKGLLTAIWDQFGVVGNDGKTLKTRFALTWSMFNVTGKDKQYGMAVSLDPYQPTARAKTLQEVARLTRGMTIVSSDPEHSGELMLTGSGKKMWIWQNRRYWTDHPGSTYEVKGIPKGTAQLEVWGWDGLRATYPIKGEPAYTVTDLPGEETYMFVARDKAQ